MISLKALMMGRDVEFPPTKVMISAAKDLLERVNDLFKALGIELLDEDLSSGYRPGRYNVEAWGSENSAHKILQALDLKDPGQKICTVLKNNKHLLEEHGLYMEHPDSTKKINAEGKLVEWCHLQSRPTKNRIFLPK